MLPGNATVFLALVYTLPQVLPILKTFLLDLSFDVCKGCDGITAPVEELCCAHCALQVVLLLLFMYLLPRYMRPGGQWQQRLFYPPT